MAIKLRDKKERKFRKTTNISGKNNAIKIPLKNLSGIKLVENLIIYEVY